MRTPTRYFCSALAICSSAHAEKTDILTITAALELRPFKSPIAAASVSPVHVRKYATPVIKFYLLEKFSNAETKSLRMRPIRSTSVTIPIEMKVAHTLTASAANSGDESAAKAGVKADPICAWYCSSSVASGKSGSAVLPKS